MREPTARNRRGHRPERVVGARPFGSDKAPRQITVAADFHPQRHWISMVEQCRRRATAHRNSADISLESGWNRGARPKKALSTCSLRATPVVRSACQEDCRSERMEWRNWPRAAEATVSIGDRPSPGWAALLMTTNPAALSPP